MTDDLKAKAMGLYCAPFKYVHGYIFDANNNMVADEAAASCLRVRGWGRISYLKDPEALQDAAGELVAEALTEYWRRRAPPAAESSAQSSKYEAVVVAAQRLLDEAEETAPRAATMAQLREALLAASTAKAADGKVP